MKVGQWGVRVVFITILIGFLTPAVYAEEESLVLQSGKKLARGATNLATGWLEVPKQIYEVGQVEGWFAGILRAPFDGLGMSLARTIAGAYEILTFPVPAPLHYQPLLQPAYVWERDPVVEPIQSANISSPAQQIP